MSTSESHPLYDKAYAAVRASPQPEDLNLDYVNRCISSTLVNVDDFSKLLSRWLRVGATLCPRQLVQDAYQYIQYNVGNDLWMKTIGMFILFRIYELVSFDPIDATGDSDYSLLNVADFDIRSQQLRMESAILSTAWFFPVKEYKQLLESMLRSIDWEQLVSNIRLDYVYHNVVTNSLSLKAKIMMVKEKCFYEILRVTTSKSLPGEQTLDRVLPGAEYILRTLDIGLSAFDPEFVQVLLEMKPRAAVDILQANLKEHSLERKKEFYSALMTTCLEVMSDHDARKYFQPDSSSVDVLNAIADAAGVDAFNTIPNEKLMYNIKGIVNRLKNINLDDYSLGPRLILYARFILQCLYKWHALKSHDMMEGRAFRNIIQSLCDKARTTESPTNVDHRWDSLHSRLLNEMAGEIIAIRNAVRATLVYSIPTEHGPYKQMQVPPREQFPIIVPMMFDFFSKRMPTAVSVYLMQFVYGFSHNPPRQQLLIKAFEAQTRWIQGIRNEVRTYGALRGSIVHISGDENATGVVCSANGASAASVLASAAGSNSKKRCYPGIQGTDGDCIGNDDVDENDVESQTNSHSQGVEEHDRAHDDTIRSTRRVRSRYT
jgi:hypothetical protein